MPNPNITLWAPDLCDDVSDCVSDNACTSETVNHDITRSELANDLANYVQTLANYLSMPINHPEHSIRLLVTSNTAADSLSKPCSINKGPIDEDSINENSQLNALIDHRFHLKIQLNDMQPMAFDFTSKEHLQRLNKVSLKSEPMAQALGLKPGHHILDATAGTGRDGLVLAALGAQVTMLERQPVFALMLKQAFKKVAQRQDNEYNNHECNSLGAKNTALQKAINLCEIYHLDACKHIQNAAFLGPFNAIYLDPMFPQRTKSAKVKKLTQILHAISGNDSDQKLLAETMLQYAKAHNIPRTVIKRPRNAELLTLAAPSFQKVGKTTRFDVYLNS